MVKKYFFLGASENTRLVKVIQILFGLVCIAVAIFWLIFNFKILKTDVTLWVTIIFLSGFGLYEIWAGLGRATRFIEIGSDQIRLKKNSVLPSVEMYAGEIEKIELLTLNVVFYLTANKRILLRFGTTYHETNEKVVDEIISFTERNSIPLEVIEEKL
ncbi:MAG TPA: hypothetical protein VMV77_02875 [Bacteroidales bacterium]|nr:hypothetical protein [Bacteroidales bacterium]